MAQAEKSCDIVLNNFVNFFDKNYLEKNTIFDLPSVFFNKIQFFPSDTRTKLHYDEQLAFAIVLALNGRKSDSDYWFDKWNESVSGWPIQKKS
jgi:hypothetical protein